MCITITKHIYKNKIKQIIHNIEYVKYMYQDTFCFGKVCARRLETKTYIQKQNQTSNKQNIEYMKYMYQDIFL
jgi:hypothetical protein